VAISVWGVRNQALSGNPTNRAITIHLITVSHLRHFASTLSTWFLPGRNVHLVGGDILPFIFLLFLIMIVLVLGHNLKSRQSWQPPKMIYIIVIFAAIYIVFLGASISFIDYLTPLDSRILSPFFVCLFIVLTYMVQQMFAKKEHVSFLMRFVFQAFIGLTLLSNFWAGASFGSVSYFSGIGFNNSSWDHSELINILEESFTTEVVYSNGFDLIYYQTNIRAEPLPKKKNRTSQVVNEDFETDLQAVNQQLSDKGGAIILMHAFEYREVFPTRADIENMFTPTSIIETTDGVIFLFSD
jgi:energy-coupling factor transporter transmembrane protein EcfT